MCTPLKKLFLVTPLSSRYCNFILRKELFNRKQVSLLSAVPCRQNYWSRDNLHLANLRTMKLDTPQFNNIFTPELKELIRLFEKYGHQLKLAGGVVRDLLMGKDAQDLDFATTATPDEMKLMFTAENVRMLNMKGEQHGTVTCRINDKVNYEVTTLRIDTKTDGRHAEVEFTTNWKLDSLRRDLTINSMFLEFDGTVLDYFNGIEDLKSKTIKFVGKPEDRIKEDYLRILRYFRFFGRICSECCEHNTETIQTIKDHVDGLAGISGERIWTEVKKIAAGNMADKVLPCMLDTGIAPYIGFTGDFNCDEVARVYQCTKSHKPLPMTIISALFYNSQQIEELHRRVKMSRAEYLLGQFLVKHRSDELDEDIFKYCQRLHLDYSEPHIDERIAELLKYRHMGQHANSPNLWQPPKFPLSGRHVIELGVKPGPKVSKLLREARQKWRDCDFQISEHDLLTFIQSKIEQS